MRWSAILLILWALPAHAQTLTATWDANPEPTVTGYKLLVGSQPRTYTSTFDVGNVTTTTFPATLLNTAYVAVVAYDGNGVVSPLSAEAVWQPAPAPIVCAYTLLGPATMLPAGTSTGTLQLTATDPSCAWTLTGLPTWVTMPTAGTGNTDLAFTVAANTGAARSATLTVGGASYQFQQAAYVPPPPPPPPPTDCQVAVPRITPGDWTQHFKLGSFGRIVITDLDWTAEMGDRRIVWIETQLGTQPAARISNPDVIATLTSLTYRSTTKGLLNLVVRAGDDKGCVGATGQLRQVRVN